MGVFARVLSDVFDPAALVLTLVFVFAVFWIFFPFLSEIQASIVFNQSPKAAFEDFLTTISDPILLIAYVVYILLMFYFSLVIVAWFLKKRTGHVENPFKAAVRVLPRAILLSILLGSPFLLLFSLYISFYPLLLSRISFYLLILLSLTYGPIIAPVLPALLDTGSAKEALREGVFVGKRWWWRILLYLASAFIVIFLVLIALALLLPSIAPFLLYLTNALFFIYSLAVVAEVYARDKFGA